MYKRKIFGVIASGVLLFSSTAPAFSVVASENSQTDETTRVQEASLFQVLNDNENDDEYEVLKDIMINQEDDLISISGNIPSLYDVVLIDSNNEESLLTEDENFIDLEFNIEDLEKNRYNLNLINTEENMEEFEINLNDILQKEDEELIKDSEVPEEEPQEELQENILEEKTSDETPQESFEPEESVETEDEIDEIQDKTHEVQEYESESSEHSYPRSSEVDEKLHGEDTEETETAHQPGIALFSARTADNGIYTVRSGDNFNAIAQSFNLSRRQLTEWNKHISNINRLAVGDQLAVTRTGVERMLSPRDKERLYKGGATSVFSSRQEFIDEIATMAIAVAGESNREALWPSLMIAQAAHESNFGESALASPPYHNLSGIKGSYNGDSVLMWTWEVLDGVNVRVLGGFRQYPSYSGSLQDYANLLRNGLSWDSNYYSGTWRSNTNSVWEVLENGGLRGYATDPNYFAAIRRIINNYDLTKYDTGSYYVRTGTFLGEQFTQQQIDKLRRQNNSYSYSLKRDENKAPYSYRRIESTQEFLGEAGAQRVINQLQREKGWSASMIPTGNSTQRFRVWSGFFNSLAEAERARDQFTNASGYSTIIEQGTDNKFRLRTGFFNGESSAQSGLEAMESLGWSANIRASNDFTPHYIVRTGTFNTPNHVNRAHDYFEKNSWGSGEQLDSRKNYYYRIYIEGFNNQHSATSYVSQLKQTYNWGSTAFPANN